MNSAYRPKLQFLSEDLIKKIIADAFEILSVLGVEIQNPSVIRLLSDSGAAVDAKSGRVFIPSELIEKSLQTTPGSFKLYDAFGEETHDFSGENIHFTPGSSALNMLDYKTQTLRQPVTSDYIDLTKIVHQLEYIASQSTSFVSHDVPEKISDSYRLFLSLLYSSKPVITGAFSIASFETMKDLQLVIRGTDRSLREKPLTVFSCCPTSPLKWSDVTSQNLVDCAIAGIPAELIAMPMAGFIAPVSLTGTLIQHTAETLSGIVISQLTSPGAPLLYGGSPAAFDMRYETTPMGAIETMMIDCAYSEIGKYLDIPTQAYIGLSDSKLLDAQAGLETGMGATLAALTGINSISGPGMMDFENCISFEKLVLDNEICGMALRLVEGIQPREDFPSIDLFRELLEEQHLLISDHTLKHLDSEHFFPRPVIDRANRSRWTEDGSRCLGERAHEQVQSLLAEYTPPGLSESTISDLIGCMEAAAKQAGLNRLPERKS